MLCVKFCQTDTSFMPYTRHRSSQGPQSYPNVSAVANFGIKRNGEPRL